MTNNSLSKEQIRVENFFENEISNYILTDIDNLSLIKPNQNGNCAIPHAMMLFAVMDLFAYLITDDINANKTKTYKNYKDLFSQKTDFFPKNYENNCDKIVKLFRHGIIHQFFPKASGVCRNGLESLLISKDGNLNVDKLSNDVTLALKKIKQLSIDKKEFAERINQRLDILAKEDYEELKDI